MTTAQQTVDRFLGELASGTGVTPETWTDDAQLDATVPGWRCERFGGADIAAQVHLLTIDADRLSRDTVCCGGRRPADLLTEMEAEMEAARGH
jgi:hypothetical protein